MRSPRPIIACLLASWTTILSPSAHAQINPDQTLGTEASVVTPAVQVRGNLSELIEGGAVRGPNLFHSFSDFNVGELNRVYFANPAGVESILSRITGGNPSNILGTLGVAGPADLYLINPNGIVFGENVSLDIAGSLYVTTAEAITLGEGLFSATLPAQSQLLEVKPSASFFNYLTSNSRDIINLGKINPGASLILAADNIQVEGELISGSNIPGSSILIVAADTVQFTGVTGRDRTGAFSGIEKNSAGVGGNLTIEASSLEVLNGAQLSSATAGSGNAGNITLDIRGTVRFAGRNPNNGRPSSASSSVETGGDGQGGTLVIQAANLEMVDGAQLRSVVAGRGNAGDVTVQISDTARFSRDASASDELAGIISNVEAQGEGQGGHIRVTAANLEVLNGAQFSTDLLGRGNVGDIAVTVGGTARFVGSNLSTILAGGLFSRVTADGEGQGGNINLTATRLEVLNGAQISTELLGAGNAGDVLITIRETALFGGTHPTFTSGAFSRMASNQGGGQGGDVRIVATNLNVTDGARLSANTSGKGNAGNIILTIGETARFEGRSSVDGLAGGVFSNVESTGEGQSGNIQITSTNLDVAGGAQINTAVAGRGNAGNVVLMTNETARFEGGLVDSNDDSGVYSRVEDRGQGQSGNITLTATNLFVNRGARITTEVLGQGNAGNIALNIAGVASFIGSNRSGNRMGFTASDVEEGFLSGVFSNVATSGAGQSGTVMLTAANLDVLNGARMSAAVAGRGNAGDLTLAIRETARIGRDRTSQTRDELPSGLFSSIEATGEGQGGNIQLSAGNLAVTDGALISTELAGRGNSGNVSLNVRETVHLAGSGSAASSLVQSGAEGGGGDVRISSNNLRITQGAQIVASNEGRGDAGNINLRVRDRIQSQDGTIGTNARLGTGGQIRIDSGLVILQHDSDIQTFVNNGGNNGGNITISARAVVALEDSDIVSFSPDGQGGEIDLSRTTLFSQNPYPISDKLLRTDLLALEGNNQADISAAGGTQSGQISINNANVVENNITDLLGSFVDTEALLANRCIARIEESPGTFVLSGRDRLPQSPNDALTNPYIAGTVSTVPADNTNLASITEPQSIYQLADGRLIMSRDCES